jgi:phosphatidyl-myo-inositol alpha-mannosyltransferase
MAKIGFVLDDSLDKTDGVQQYVLTLGQWMRHQGHEVHYLVGHTERTDIPHIHSLSRNIQTHFNQNRMSTPLPASKKLIKELLDKERFDALHIQMPYSPFMAGRVIKAAPKRTKVIGTFHIIPFSWIEKLATRLLGLVLWRTLRRFNAIYSVSEPARIFARRSFGVKSSVLPNVVNVAAFHVGKPIRKYNDGKINIVFLGRLVERKGCMLLLKALEQLHQQHQLTNARVLICGKGQLLPELEKFVKDHHLRTVVHFVGFVSEEEKPHYLATADIAVFPSTGGESFGIVLIEAMAAGSRVVLGGNNIGYSSVLNQRPELLVNPLDTVEFAKTLKHFIASKRARLSAHAWQNQHVQQYDVAVVGRKLLEQYER